MSVEKKCRGTKSLLTGKCRKGEEMRLRDVPRIRWKIAEDQQVVATSKRKPFRRDEVFEDTGRENRFGFYWIRETRRAAGAAEQKYRQHLVAREVGVDSEHIADLDGILYFVTEDPEVIPEWFKVSQSQIDAGKRLAETYGFKSSTP